MAPKVERKRKAAAPEPSTATKKAKTAQTSKPAPAKKSAKAPPPPPPPPVEADLAGFGSSDSEQDQTAHLTGFSSGEDDNEEEEPTDALPLTSLPAPPAAATSALSKSRPSSSAPGVIYLSRIPHGFYERQMRGYFSQFGTVSRLRLARNRRTGASKHHAWIEFSDAEVARIAAETMNNYLLFGHLMKVDLVPAERVHAELFKGSEKRFRKVPWNAIERTRVAKTDRAGWGKRVGREEKRRSSKAKKLAEMGYEFEAPGLRQVEDVEVRVGDAKDGDAGAVAGAKGQKNVKAIEAAKPEEQVTVDKILGKTQAGKGADAVKVAVKGEKKGGVKKEKVVATAVKDGKKSVKKTKTVKA